MNELELMAELVSMLDELLMWENEMGGWDARCWRDAQELLDRGRTKGADNDDTSLGGGVQG